MTQERRRSGEGKVKQHSFGDSDLFPDPKPLGGTVTRPPSQRRRNRRASSLQPPAAMCHVIVTCRSMLWTLLSIVAAFGELIAFMSTDWLVGYPRTPDAVFGRHGATAAGEAYRPTLGIYGRCIKLPHLQRGILCGPYAIHFGEIASGFWQATSIFLAAGILLLCAVAFISVFTMCFQSIMKKSIFNVCGLLQGIAGEVPRRSML